MMLPPVCVLLKIEYRPQWMWSWFLLVVWYWQRESKTVECLVSKGSRWKFPWKLQGTHEPLLICECHFVKYCKILITFSFLTEFFFSNRNASESARRELWRAKIETTECNSVSWFSGSISSLKLHNPWGTQGCTMIKCQNANLGGEVGGQQMWCVSGTASMCRVRVMWPMETAEESLGYWLYTCIYVFFHDPDKISRYCVSIRWICGLKVETLLGTHWCNLLDLFWHRYWPYLVNLVLAMTCLIHLKLFLCQCCYKIQCFHYQLHLVSYGTFLKSRQSLASC